MPQLPRLAAAVNDFHLARQRAALEMILARLTGKSAELLSFDDVRRKLRASGSTPRGERDIPLDAIVGSVGRYADFTRSFLPKQDSDEDRWARVGATDDLLALPPIEVYQIGEAYFVRDGNHRVSVARQKGLRYLPAYVYEVQTRVPLSADAGPDELIAKAEAVAFLEYTRLGETCSGVDLMVSIPGQYAHLENHIEVHRYFMEEERGHEIPLEDAACDWYNNAYLPVVQVIREQDILQDFPGRTEADLYLWLSQHRVAIRKELGLDIQPQTAVAELAARFSPRPERIAARTARRVLSAVMPDELGAGPPPGQWRREHLVTHRAGRLFDDMLVAVSGDEAGWRALDQAFEIARREQARVYGFHAAASEDEAVLEKAKSVEAEFDRRCEAAGLVGKLAFEVGEVARKISERSWWVDLIVLSLSYPPPPQPLAKLSSGLRTILRQCARPVLAVPGLASPLARALLAHDGSPRADEALFVATYLAGQWNMSLVVLTVETDRTKPETQRRAREYLAEHGVEATFVQKRAPVAGTILTAAEEYQCDWTIMGSYGPNPLVEVVRGSAVDEVLRGSQKPILICR